MARRRPDTSAYTTFSEICERLDEIVGEVRRRDLPLESSLDLFDEAVALASKATDLVDTQEPTPEELAALREGDGEDAGREGASQDEGAGAAEGGNA